MIAFVGFLPSMCSFMSSKLTMICKCFPTLLTFIRFLSNSYSFIYLETTVIYKVFTILNNFIGFLSSMNSFMPLRIMVICKGFTTFITFIRLLSSGTSFMPSTSSRALTMFFSRMGFPIVAYGTEVPVGLQHHIFVETLLGRIQQNPFFLSEVHMHIIIAHCIHALSPTVADTSDSVNYTQGSSFCPLS